MVNYNFKTRRIDNLRRFVIPKTFFKALNFKVGQKVELTIEYGCICIKAFDSCNIEERPYIGIVRSIDIAHRIVIPAEFLDVLDIKKDSIVLTQLDGEILKVFPHQ